MNIQREIEIREVKQGKYMPRWYKAYTTLEELPPFVSVVYRHHGIYAVDLDCLKPEQRFILLGIKKDLA